MKHILQWVGRDETKHGTLCGASGESFVAAQRSSLRGQDLCPDCVAIGIKLYKKMAPHFALALHEYRSNKLEENELCRHPAGCSNWAQQQNGLLCGPHNKISEARE